ncbi:MAG: hypothetical protein JXO22_05985 [Phycisphaerae bacterium]|nr:hypothetical protein [Phycisphaerae bacterium]
MSKRGGQVVGVRWMCAAVFVVGLGVVLAGPQAEPTYPAAPYTLPTEVAQLDDNRINEASGITASRRNPGMYYINNDSGDEPRVFLVDRAGHTRVTIRLHGARHIDYEDIALAPGAKAGEFDVCVADIGDNNGQRHDLTIYRFAEIDGEGGVSTIDVEPRMYRIRYAGGPCDAEALAVDPLSGDGFIFTKRRDGKPLNVYRLPAPWPTDKIVELAEVATVALPPEAPMRRLVTAADISPDGRRLALRCYTEGWEWRLADTSAKPDVATLLKQTPLRITLAAEPQGEALCYTADGQSLVTVSEQLPTHLFEVRPEPTEKPAP